MSKIIHYLDSQSDIRLLADAQLYYQEIRTTDLLFFVAGKGRISGRRQKKCDEKR
ncbi:hypothetical protein [Enterococcus casseliflavus]|uniref:hypothetical protein n=1 Tax=Enterococcus casseliflavus TaxID=37734 RepID=UPI001F34E518|nr:hypothetical protein [Enterococcus casseliflavus]